MFFLGHNFGCRHAKMSIKDSMDAADRLVSNKSLSQKNNSLDCRQMPFKIGQKCKNMPFL